ncbi:MAG: hypothetical protein JKY37_05470 [Nannocystaceae bacterium]|nr:hypothetical protein [Nannocystaceae bacterium]
MQIHRHGGADASIARVPPSPGTRIFGSPNSRQVHDFLVDEGLVEISRARIRLSEENIGVYGVDALVLTFGSVAIVLNPMGTLMVGSRGRIDLYRRGRRGAQSAMLILSGSKKDASWAIWQSRDPRDEDPLSWKTFERALERLL